jgi:hypothetical protein
VLGAGAASLVRGAGCRVQDYVERGERMQRIVSFLIATAMAFGSYAARAAGDSKAADLLTQARAAIGGEKQINRVQGLSCTGTVQRMLGDRQISGELTLDLQLPDKMLRTESISPMGDGALVISEQGINGDSLLRTMRTMNAPPGMMIRTPPPPAPGSEADTQALRNSRAELSRLALGLLLTSTAALPVDFTYAGEAESPDGNAAVLDVTGANNFVAQLFLDKQTHRPLMMAYRGASPRMIVQTQRVQGPPPPNRTEHAEAPGQPPPPEIVDINMFFHDYRWVDGVMIPHHISRAVGGQTTEEWTFTSVMVNPIFKADTFAKR